MAVNKAKVLKDAQKFIAKGQLDKAIVEYEKLVKDAPNDTNMHNAVGDLYLKKGDKAKAIVHYSKAAEVLNKDGFTLKAIALYKKVLNINPEQVDVLLVMGRLNAERGMVGNANENYLAAASYYTREGKRDRVLEVYKSLSKLNPDSLHMQQKLAELYLAEGLESEAAAKFISLAEKKVEGSNYAEARHILNKAVGKGSERADYMRVSALIDMGEGRMPEALEKLVAARDVSPDNVKVLKLLGEVFLKTGEYERATDVLKSILKVEPDSYDVQKKLIEVSLKSGDFGSAWEGYRGLVEGHIDRKEYDKAEKLLNEYTGHDQKSIDARQMLADLYGSIGREDKVTKLNLVIAELYDEKGDTEKARNICTQLLEKEPDNQDIKDALSRIDSPAAPKKAAAPAPKPAPRPAPEAAASLEDTGFEISGEHEQPPVEVTRLEEPVPEESGFSLDAPFEGMEDIPLQEEIPSDPGAESPFGGFEAEAEAQESDTETEAAPGEDLGGFGLEEADDDFSGEHGFGELPPELGGGSHGEHFSGGLETVGFDTGEKEPESDFIADTPFSTYDEPAPDLDMPGGGETEPPFGSDEPPDTVERDISSPEMQLGGFEPEPAEEDGESVFDLGEAADELSSISLQNMAESIGRDVQEEGVYDLSEEPVASMDEFSSGDKADGTETVSLGISDEPASFEERLTEVDVYVKYGLFPKAKETLGALSATHPNNPEIVKRRLDISKAEGDKESYASHALELGGIYYSKGMEDEAVEVLSRASQLCPGDERISRKLDALRAAPSVPSGPAAATVRETPVEEPAAAVEEEASFAGLDEEEDVSFVELEQEEEVSFAGLGEEEDAEEEEDSAVADAMSEADFYAQQGLHDEALGIYRRILASNPEYGEARSRYDKLMAEARSKREAEAELEIEVVDEEPEVLSAAPSSDRMDDELDVAFGEYDDVETAEVAETAEPAAKPRKAPAGEEGVGDEDFFDLAAELRDEMGGELKAEPLQPVKESVFGDAGLDAAFEEFKKGVEDQIGSEDYETHYNLGIAYKEMGMLDEALAEFNEASRDPSKTLDCASMLGLCYIERGEYATAIDYFKKGLRVAGRSREEYLGIKYDMATAYELNGDVASAQSLISDVFNEDKSFRDVKKRLQRLNRQVVEAGGVQDDSDEAGETESAKPKPVKKNKVSYL